MAYFGKTFKFVREENYDALLNSQGEGAKQFLSFKPDLKIVKDGDGYKLTIFTPGGDKVVSFKNGEPFEEDVRSMKVQSIITVDGDTFTQIQDFGTVKLTIKREYSPTTLKATLTVNNWDGVAYRYYEAA